MTNLHAGGDLDSERLPLAYTAHTPCFRSEAGSYGRDTRGLIRLHQFVKVELVRVVDAERSSDELEIMLSHAETCLQELGLAYRVVVLPAGDIGTKSKDGKHGFAATLNGFGLPIGRTLVAILEQNQEADGSVRMPDVLVPYLGFHRINADGTTATA